jgi:hypothetical protein
MGVNLYGFPNGNNGFGGAGVNAAPATTDTASSMSAYRRVILKIFRFLEFSDEFGYLFNRKRYGFLIVAGIIITRWLDGCTYRGAFSTVQDLVK